jgi:hypothetical protein
VRVVVVVVVVVVVDVRVVVVVVLRLWSLWGGYRHETAAGGPNECQRVEMWSARIRG